jgi:hypothetical protein
MKKGRDTMPIGEVEKSPPFDRLFKQRTEAG